MEENPKQSKFTVSKALEERFTHEVEGELTTMLNDGDTLCIDISQKDRFDKWILSLKLRYWLDLGERDIYDVDWCKKVNDENVLEDIIINIKKPDATNEILFSIMAHIPEKQIRIQSKFMDVWKVNEYQKLVLLVSKLCLRPDTDQEIVGQLYTETFYNQNVSDISNLYNINLDNVSLDVYAESDSENNYVEQETEEIVNEESEPIKSAKKTKIKPHRLSTSSSTPPSKQKKCRQSLPTKKEHTIPETSDLQQILTTINALSKRIDKLETVTVKLDKNMANTVLDIKTMNNVVCELRNELTKSVDSTLKHELSVVREEQHNLKDEMED